MTRTLNACLRLPWALAGAVLAIGLFIDLSGDPAAAAKKPKTVTVEAVTLAPRQLVSTVSAIGTLHSNEAVIVRPEIDGRVVEIGFKEGQTVKKSDVLFRLDSTIFAAELAEARARLALSERNYERSKALQSRGHTSVENLERAFAQLQVDRARIKLAQARLEKMVILAPFDGIVGLRRVSIGDYVKAGSDLVNLEDIDPIKLEFHLPERYIRFIRPDSNVRILPDALPGSTFEGKVYAIDPRIESAGRSIAIRARLANKDHVLRPGMFARLKLIINRNKKALVVPEEAIVRHGNQQVVFKIVKGVAVMTAVTLGLRQTGYVEIVHGLHRGDTIVTAGHAKLRQGSAVKAVSPAEVRD